MKVLMLAAATALGLCCAASSFASSHREAPFITEHPKEIGRASCRERV